MLLCIKTKNNITYFLILLGVMVSTSCSTTSLQQHNESQAQINSRKAVVSQEDSRGATTGVISRFTPATKVTTDYADTLPATTGLWKRIRKGYQLDLTVENSRIKEQRDWYAGHQQYLDQVAARGQRYLYHIAQRIEKQGLPMELALLPIIESAFDPFAYSPSKASGIWQFIPGTGKHYGLDQNWWYDGRRDVVASTEAALNYFEYLNKQFEGDWLLALAAYNSGEGTVRRAIQRNQSEGKPTDFWSLDLPSETQTYVPKLLGLAQLIKNPQDYGVNLETLPNEPFFDRFDLGSQIDLTQAARMAGISLDDFYLLNPGFNQWTTPPQGPHFVNIPAENARRFEHALANLPEEKRVNWLRYKIRKGDTLSAIAVQHKTTQVAIKQLNQMHNNSLRAGNELLIPVPGKRAEPKALSKIQRRIAKQNETYTGQLKNRHTVRSGESFWKISKQYGVALEDLARWNGMSTKDALKVGQKLVFWTDPLKMASLARPDAHRQSVRTINYRVKKGDTLTQIAEKFSVSIGNIEAWNDISRKQHLQPDQTLVLHVNITQASL